MRKFPFLFPLPSNTAELGHSSAFIMASLQLNIPLVYTPFDSEVTDCFLGLMIFSFFISLLCMLLVEKYCWLCFFFPGYFLPSTPYGLL